MKEMEMTIGITDGGDIIYPKVVVAPLSEEEMAELEGEEDMVMNVTFRRVSASFADSILFDEGGDAE